MGSKYGCVPRAANVKERLHRQNGINRNMTNPSLLPCQLKRLAEIGTLKGRGVVAFPNYRSG